jgi:thioredoxin reductase (NADPH)
MEQHGDVVILRKSNITKIVDENKRPKVFFKEDQYAPETFDRVVYALGGTTPSNFLRSIGIAFNQDGPVVDRNGETNVPGLFVLGDLVVGPKGGSIITAFNSAVRSMQRICAAYLPCGPCA